MELCSGIKRGTVCLPMASKKNPRLVFSSDDGPGFSRRRCGRGFSYRDTAGERIGDEGIIKRIQALAIPPAYEGVWICPLETGHLQATGRDLRKRKQYRYHPEWVRQRNETKFSQLADFARLLPRIRRRVQADLLDDEISKRRVVAAAIRVIDHTGARVGNEAYAKENKSYGITTLREDHFVEDTDKSAAKGSDYQSASDGHDKLELAYMGKSGQPVRLDFRSDRVAQLLDQARDLPGEHLFHYQTSDDGSAPIYSSDVNDYLHEVSDEITAKDFRTWKASLLCFSYLSGIDPPSSGAARDREIVAAIKATAKHLHHRPATCRKYYVHPKIVQAFEAGESLEGAERFVADRVPRGDLSTMEESLLEFLDDEL